MTQANNSLQPAPVGRLSSAFAVDITGPAWLSCQLAARAYANVHLFNLWERMA